MTVAVGLEAGTGTAIAARPGQVVRDYVAITKPRVVVLLEVVTFFAMVMAARGWPGFSLTLATLTGGWLAAGGAHAINCWFDRDIDAAMGRTRSRPIPAGRIRPQSALAFGVVLGAASFALLAVAVNMLAATLALGGLLFYVFIYTMWLKRSPCRTSWWAARRAPSHRWSAGRRSTAASPSQLFFLFAVVFYWTPPHFWALALLIRRDYASVSVPMLPVVLGERETRRQILLYTGVLVLVTIMPLLVRSFGAIYMVEQVFSTRSSWPQR